MDIYLQKKDLLMRKKPLARTERDFVQQRKNWVEPQEFCFVLERSPELQSGDNFFEWKQFFQKKSALTLKSRTKSSYPLGRTLGFTWLPPWRKRI